MIIVKIGGGNSLNINSIISDLSKIEEPVIIVHGANALRDELAAKLGLEKKTVTSVSGYQSVFSDEEALNVMMMAYSGLKNKRIVELCQQNGVNAVGLTGIDGRLIEGKRNNGIRVREDGKMKILRDFSGKPKKINLKLLNLLIENGFVPVITVPLIDEDGYAINSENDDVVALLTNVLKADKVIQLIEAPGLMEDPKNPDSLIKSLSSMELEKIESQVEGRMKRKILAIRKLYETTNPIVYISDGRIENPIINALQEEGTTIK